MSIQTEVTMLTRRLEDLEQAHEVALNEKTGKAEGLLAKMRDVEARLAVLIPLVEAQAYAAAPMKDCSSCHRPFWPENLTDGRCEYCGPPGGETPSESIQSVKQKGPRASRR